MSGPIGGFALRYAILVGFLTTFIAGGGEALAQDAPSAGPTGSLREQELREQLNNILKELDEIQQQKYSATP